MSKKTKKKPALLPIILGLFTMLVLGWIVLPIFSNDAKIVYQAGTKPGPIGGNDDMAPDFSAIMEHQMPPHTFFAPLAHSKDSCNECHNFSTSKLLAHFNITFGGQKTENGTVSYNVIPITMADCQRCHAIPAHANAGAGNSCGTCHR